MEIRLGSGQFIQKLDRLEHILKDLESRGARADVVRLDSVKDPDRVAVHMHYPEREVAAPVKQKQMPVLQRGSGERLPPKIHKKSPPSGGQVVKKKENSSKLDEILGE